MIPFQEKIRERGQALAEMVLSIPLLLLFAAGITQFSVIFLCDVQFEHACGEAARQYAAGIVGKKSIEPIVWENLGYFRRFFDAQALTAVPQSPQSKTLGALDSVRHSMALIPGTLHYDGAEWRVQIRCHPPFFFTLLFPRGLAFETIMQVNRYPK